MEEYLKEGDFESYKRFIRHCKCGCEMHCGHSCLDCDYCTECECEYCTEGKGQN